MPTPAIEKLLVLQDRDQQRLALEAQLKAVPRDIAAVEQKIAAEKAAIETARGRVKGTRGEKEGDRDTRSAPPRSGWQNTKASSCRCGKTTNIRRSATRSRSRKPQIGALEEEELKVMYAIDEAKRKFAAAGEELKRNIAGHEARIRAAARARDRPAVRAAGGARKRSPAARGLLDEPALRLYDRLAAQARPARRGAHPRGQMRRVPSQDFVQCRQRDAQTRQARDLRPVRRGSSTGRRERRERPRPPQGEEDGDRRTSCPAGRKSYPCPEKAVLLLVSSCFSLPRPWSWGQIVAPFFGNIPTARVNPRPVRLPSGATRTLQAVRRGKSGHPRAGFPARNVVAPARLAARPPAGGASAQAGARRVKPPRRTVPQRRYRPASGESERESERGNPFHFHPRFHSRPARVKRWGKSPPRRQQCRRQGKPNPVQDKIGDWTARPTVPGMSHPPALALRAVEGGSRKGSERNDGQPRRKPGHRIRLTAPRPRPAARHSARRRTPACEGEKPTLTCRGALGCSTPSHPPAPISIPMANTKSAIKNARKSTEAHAAQQGGENAPQDAGEAAGDRHEVRRRRGGQERGDRLCRRESTRPSGAASSTPMPPRG